MPKRTMTETPDYLHFKHKFGFLENFTQLYQAFFYSCQQKDIKIDHQRCDNFFLKYIDNMGLEFEFKQAVIDPRAFSIQIFDKYGKYQTDTVHINAGRLHVFQKEFLPLIDIKGLTECSLKIDGITYTLKLEES